VRTKIKRKNQLRTKIDTGSVLVENKAHLIMTVPLVHKFFQKQLHKLVTLLSHRFASLGTHQILERQQLRNKVNNAVLIYNSMII
jgi:hypothetical protein